MRKKRGPRGQTISTKGINQNEATTAEVVLSARSTSRTRRRELIMGKNIWPATPKEQPNKHTHIMNRDADDNTYQAATDPMQPKHDPESLGELCSGFEFCTKATKYISGKSGGSQNSRKRQKKGGEKLKHVPSTGVRVVKMEYAIETTAVTTT